MENSGVLDAEELTFFARRALERLDLEKALVAAKLALCQPDFPPVCHAVVGKIYAQMGLYDRASQFLTTYIDMFPGDYHERCQLGLVLFRSGDEEGALLVWEQALQYDKTHPPVLFYPAHAHAAKQSWSTAQRFIDILLTAAGSENLFSIKAQQLRTWINEANASPGKKELNWPTDLNDELLFG